MRAFTAIVKQTVRSAVRSHVFHVLGVLILLAVFLLPVTVSGDGTAAGQLQIAITYSLGVVVALISTTTLWLSCALLYVYFAAAALLAGGIAMLQTDLLSELERLALRLPLPLPLFGFLKTLVLAR